MAAKHWKLFTDGESLKTWVENICPNKKPE